MNLLLITGETEELIMGKPTNEDWNAGLVLKTFQEENSYLRKTFAKHYVLIKDFNKFMYNQTKHEHRKYFCMYCLQCFSREDVLAEHKNNCISINGKQAIKMPEEGDKVYFKNHHKQLSVPFVIYADFEAITEKVQGCQPNTDKSYTEAYQQHKDCGYGWSSVVMMTNTVNQKRYTEVKMLFTNLWKICLRKLIGVNQK